MLLLSQQIWFLSPHHFSHHGPQVSQWIADRINENASPVSPATFPSYPGPSPSSDWSSQRRDKSSPLRGPHGKFVSPISVGGYSSCSSSPDQAATPQRPRGERHTGMAELAKHVSETLRYSKYIEDGNSTHKRDFKNYCYPVFVVQTP